MSQRTLGGGNVADEQVTDADTNAIRVFKATVHEDCRVLPVMVPIGDGLTLMIKH